MLPESAQRRRVVGWTPNIELASVRESQSLRSKDIAVTACWLVKSSFAKAM